jgi:hypothetical protein
MSLYGWGGPPPRSDEEVTKPGMVPPYALEQWAQKTLNPTGEQVPIEVRPCYVCARLTSAYVPRGPVAGSIQRPRLCLLCAENLHRSAR